MPTHRPHPAEPQPTDKETEEYWRYIERVAEHVETWPDWKKGKLEQEPGSPSTPPSSAPGEGAGTSR
jgi:hypothetical protein